MATREQYLDALKRAASAGDNASANEIADYISGNLPSAAELRQEDFDAMPWYEKAAVGAGQSVAELGTGIKEMFGGDVSQAHADSAMVDSVDSGWKTTGQVGGELATALIPGGAIGKGISKGLPLAMRANKAARYGGRLAGDVAAVGATEALRGRDGLQASGITAGVGAALPAAFKGAGKLIAPMREGAEELLDAGVRLSPGQARGGMIGAAEEAMSYIPGVAGGVRKIREKALKDWNQYIRTGEALPMGWAGPQQNQQVMKEAFDESYSMLFNREVSLARDLPARWGNILKEARRVMPPKEVKQVSRVLSNFTAPLKKATADGRSIQQIDRGLTKLSRQANARGDQLQSEAYAAARDQLRDSLPKAMREELTSLNNSYSKFSVLRDASAKAGPAKRKPPGMITPGDLMASSIKGRKSAASVGTAPLQKEAEVASEILGPNMPLSSGIQGAAASLGPAATLGLGLMDIGTLGGAAAVRGGLVNEGGRRLLVRPPTDLAARGAAALAGVGIDVSGGLTEEEARRQALIEQLRRHRR